MDLGMDAGKVHELSGEPCQTQYKPDQQLPDVTQRLHQTAGGVADSLKQFVPTRCDRIHVFL